MKLMWRYTIKNKKLLFFNFLFVFGFILIELGLPTLLARIIDNGILKNDADYVKQMGLTMLGIVLIGIIMNISLGYVTARITTNMVESIRNDLFEKIDEFLKLLVV